MADEKEKQAFYKTNAKILKLDTIKDQDLILFNHHIEKEENLQRLSGELQKGLFKFSYPKAEIDLGFSRWKLQKIVKYFEENKIIECIEKSTKNRDNFLRYISNEEWSKSKKSGKKNLKRKLRIKLCNF